METFGWAIKQLQHGSKVARSGWNGKGMFLFYVHDWNHDGNVVMQDVLDRLPFVAMKTADDKVVPWLASQTDLLAVDWSVVS